MVDGTDIVSQMADETLIENPAPADTPAPDTPAPAADPAPAEAPAPKTSLEALSSRLKEMQAKAPEAKTEDKPAEEAKKPEGEAEDDDLPGENPDEKKAFKGKPADEQIKGLRTKLRMTTREANQMRAELETLRPAQERAKAFDEFSGWVKSTGLTQEEVTQGLQISALMKTDPFKALEIVTPIYAELQRRAGAALPDDLRAEVDSGMVTEERAKEIARLRAQSQHAQTGWQQTAAQRQAEQEQQQVAALQNQVRTAVNAAEAEVRQNDPDYAKKAPLVMTEVKALWMDEGYPTNAEQAVAQYKKALKQVNDRIALITPRGKPMSPAPTQQGGNVVATPKNSAEAVRLAALSKGIRIAG